MSSDFADSLMTASEFIACFPDDWWGTIDIPPKLPRVVMAVMFRSYHAQIMIGFQSNGLHTFSVIPSYGERVYLEHITKADVFAELGAIDGFLTPAELSDDDRKGL